MPPLNRWFALDIEYCNRINPKSEIIIFGDPEDSQAQGYLALDH